jgi:hypothetical protein
MPLDGLWDDTTQSILKMTKLIIAWGSSELSLLAQYKTMPWADFGSNLL